MKTFIQDIERALYDVRDADKSIYKSDAGLTEEIIRDISARKNDPPWMLEFRLKSLEVYKKISLPTWGPDISALNMDEIVTYVKPNAKQVDDWSQVPDEIKKTFDRLGIPEAEKNRSRASARNTIRRSFITAFKSGSRIWASCTPTWRPRSSNTKTLFANIL